MTKTPLLVGSRVEVIPISPIGENIWSARAVSLPEGWSCNLIHRYIRHDRTWQGPDRLAPQCVYRSAPRRSIGFELWISSHL